MSSIQSMKRFTPGDFEELKSSYFPSMIHVNQHTTDTHVGLLLQIPGVHRRCYRGYVQPLIDLRNFPIIPHAYVLTPSCQDIHHLNVAVNRSFSVALGCRFAGFVREVFHSSGKKLAAQVSSNAKIKRFLEQIDHVLNNPNPEDPAREV